jgi:trimethylamine--corrinoid protein Co-methyltransferase
VAREGIIVEPYTRLKTEQIEKIHNASLYILKEIGIECFNKEATEILNEKGAEVSLLGEGNAKRWLVKIPEKVVSDGLQSAPKVVKLGARDENNSLILDGGEPRVYFASGSEANNWLDVDIEVFVNKKNPEIETALPWFTVQRGTLDRLSTAAHLCEHLDTWDSFLRTVNVQDDDINDENKDVNKFFASLNNTTKHVMSGLTTLTRLDNVMTMARIIAGGEKELKENPVVSFITCMAKSPLQFVDDTTQKAMEIARRNMPLVVSSSPQGGSTAPITEEGMTAQINAEILAGIALMQLVNKGAPVLYGSVPVRSRMDDLHDSYGAPEFNQYNIDCVQMARYYGLPCYSTGGISDARVPGVQAAIERLFSHVVVTMAGPQYLHYAFGLLERTNTFCPVQAILDDAQIHMVKKFVQQPVITDDKISECLEQIEKTMSTSHKLYTRYVRTAMRRGEIAPPYPYESAGMKDETMIKASEHMDNILSMPRRHIEASMIDEIYRSVPGLLDRLKN